MKKKDKKRMEMLLTALSQPRPIIENGVFWPYVITNRGEVIRDGEKNTILFFDEKANRWFAILESRTEKPYKLDIRYKVAKEYVPNENNYTKVRFKTGDGSNIDTDYHYSNLEWVASTVTKEEVSTELPKIPLTEQELALCVWHYNIKELKGSNNNFTTIANRFNISADECVMLLNRYKDNLNKEWHLTRLPDPDERRRKQAKFLRPYIIWMLNNDGPDVKNIYDRIKLENCDIDQMKRIVRNITENTKHKDRLVSKYHKKRRR